MSHAIDPELDGMLDYAKNLQSGIIKKVRASVLIYSPTPL